MKDELNLGIVSGSADITKKQILVRNALLDDPKIKAYQHAKMEIVVCANLRFVDKGDEIEMKMIYTKEQSEALRVLDELMELQTEAIIKHYS